MATWVTHLMIADYVLERVPDLCRHEFCVGNIAPDCNIEEYESFLDNAIAMVVNAILIYKNSRVKCKGLYEEKR